ncbi:translation initiation factor Sui1 [Desulfotalea psychrophila]|uniref:SUI1 domain-containing protein n=1 Tax=Desulfotalea psychrophila (strain LSv54 / DSM 12343) TaxID=177439 RepID=Q6ARD4_DESPS|nr:translation initiation factor Sui1 [Desulfotalea psychrophila]CAG35090.1 conserved hypothetical protein [Desulfotalea psychrophila LSv54]
MKNVKNKGLVYSTEVGKVCPKCGHPVKACRCSQGKTVIAIDGVVRVSRQSKGRKGAGVTLVTGLPLVEADLKKYAKQLKQKCGSGGTVKGGVIEIQGDHRSLLLDYLLSSGYKAKLAGG